MRAICTFLNSALLVLITMPAVQAEQFIWARQLGGTQGDHAIGVALDASGSIYTVGSFSGTADFDPGPGTLELTSAGWDDAFISKLDRAGNFVWARRLGGADPVSADSVALDTSGNLYTVGSFWGTADFDPGPETYELTSAGGEDAFISKLDSAGNFLWAKRLGGTSRWDFADGVAVDASGNVYTVGNFAGTADFDPGPGTYELISAGGDDVFISKLDSAGDFVWARSLGWTDLDYTRGVALDTNGNLYTVGTFWGTADFDPGPGTYELTSAGEMDVFISKLDGAGEFIWAKKLGGADLDYARGVALDTSGQAYTVGSFRSTADFDPGPGNYELTSTGGIDVFISKVDSAGNFVWARRLGGTDDDRADGVAVDADGNAYVAGYFRGTADFDPGPGTFELTSAGEFDAFIFKLDATGDFVWAKRLGGADLEYAHCVAVDTSGDLYTVGSFGDTADFDPGPGTFNLTPAGEHDAFVSRLGPPPPDNDGDGFTPEDGDCNDTPAIGAAIYPGAPQICDGLNNDCDHPDWPQLQGTTEFDDDGDGLTECNSPSDCNDDDGAVYPDAPEVNDGVDNQCPGDDGHGSVDEVGGSCGFHDAEDSTVFSWIAQQGVTHYEVARSVLSDFSFGCVLLQTGSPQVTDPQTPGAGGTFYYLIRAAAPHEGCWGQDSAGHVREVCTSAGWRVNFQPESSDLPHGYAADWGQAFDPTRGYGWLASQVGNTRDRNIESDPRKDTLLFVRDVPRQWELATPPGNYAVTLTVGDAQYPQQQWLDVEGVNVFAGEPTDPGEFRTATVGVAVDDGRLTLTVGGGAPQVTTLNYVEVAATEHLAAVNFQPETSAVPPGFTLDAGRVHSLERGYGWQDNTLFDSGQTRDRLLADDPLLDTLVYTGASVKTWQFPVADGEYFVELTVGDAQYGQGPHRVIVEGVPFVDGETTIGGEFLTSTGCVAVADGSLTIVIGGGGGNTALNYVRVDSGTCGSVRHGNSRLAR